MNIVLLGYRGSGKTTIGRMIAEQLWKTFADVDTDIMKRFGGLNVQQIWDKHGEPEYRRVEGEVTQALVAKTDHVIALGGGTLMFPVARAAVEGAKDTVKIYLQSTPEELHRRIAADKQTAATRPSLTKHGGGLEEIKEMLAKREPVYLAVATKVFDVTHVTPEDAVRHIIKRCL